MAHATVADKSGKTHEVYRQEKTHSCAIACAAMMINRITGEILDEKILRKESRATKDEGFSKSGIYLRDVIPLLSRRGITAKESAGLTWNLMKHYARKGEPVICTVAWNQRAVHMVMIDGQTPNGEVIICDPDAGIGGAGGTPANNLWYLGSEDSFKFYRGNNPGGMFTGHYVHKTLVVKREDGFGYDMPSVAFTRSKMISQQARAPHSPIKK